MMSETTPQPTWVIMPFRNAPEMTLIAVGDALAQTVPTRVLLVDQGASQADREVIDQWIDQRADHRALCWHFLPMLPSLSMVWNRALAFVWELGGEVALVANNDTRCWPGTVEGLLHTVEKTGALFVSAVGVKEAQYTEWLKQPHDAPVDTDNRGGPDYSFFLITKAGHWSYPFDERFIPAFFEDLDSHRRYMIGGDGHLIFSVNIPYVHYASQTLKTYSPEERAAFNRQSVRNREYYRQKWGGYVNEETLTRPFDGATARAGVTTPELQRRALAGEAVLGG